VLTVLNLGRVVSRGPGIRTTQLRPRSSRRSRSCCRLRGWLVQGRSLRGVPRRNATRKHALVGEATRSVPAMAVDLVVACAKYGIMEAVAIAVTAVVGLIAYPLLQPAWVMVK